MTPLAAGLFVFFMRVIDMSLDTLRLLFVMRGWKYQAGALGAVQATVFILAVSTVLQGPLNVYTVIGYAAGFGAGVIIGMVAEERLALGYLMFRIYSSEHGPEIAQLLREAGFAVTEFSGQGRDSTLTVINSAVARRHRQTVRALVEQIDPAAFITVDDVHPLQRGYFRH